LAGVVEVKLLFALAQIIHLYCSGDKHLLKARKEPLKARKKQKNSSRKTEKRIHPWRLCSAGRHWVRTHPLHIPPSEKDPTGHVTTRHGHCADNPSGKDQLYPDEIQEMADKNFSKVKDKPCPLDLGFHQNGNRYDDLIAGWTKYWNEVLRPAVPLDPNVVKALIATESGFDTNSLANNNQNGARGLMQITNDSRKILADEKGELKDHFVTVTREELNNPSNNICAGIRWLFHKQRLLSSRLKRNATWEEAISEYKGLRTVTKSRAKKLIEDFNAKLKELEKCGKS
jgi:hypothetical protein